MCKVNVKQKIRVPIQQAISETLKQTAYATFKAWFDTTGAANREWMKITEDTKPFPGVPQHYWGLMSDGDELPDFSANYADAFFGVGGRAAAPAAATAPGAAATPASAAPFLDMDLAVARSVDHGLSDFLVCLAAPCTSHCIEQHRMLFIVSFYAEIELFGNMD